MYNVLFIPETSCVAPGMIFKCSSLQYENSPSFLDADPTAVYTMFTVKHSLLSVNLALFLHFHSCLQGVNEIICQL